MPESVSAGGDVPQSNSDELSKWINSPDYNPFKAPPDSDMFVIRDQESEMTSSHITHCHIMSHTND
jgi:hypothetical protein